VSKRTPITSENLSPSCWRGAFGNQSHKRRPTCSRAHRAGRQGRLRQPARRRRLGHHDQRPQGERFDLGGSGRAPGSGTSGSLRVITTSTAGSMASARSASSPSSSARPEPSVGARHEVPTDRRHRELDRPSVDNTPGSLEYQRLTDGGDERSGQPPSWRFNDPALKYRVHASIHRAGSARPGRSRRARSAGA